MKNRYKKYYLKCLLRFSFALLVAHIPLTHASSASAARAKLTWDANSEADLAGYNIYAKVGSSPAKDSYDRKISLALAELADAGAPEYEADTLDESETTYFAVTAYDSAHNESELSNVVSYTPIVPANLVPTASLTANPASGEAPLAVSFSGATSNDPDGTIVSYYWHFGDGAAGTGSSINHTYSAAGIYTVTLSVTDDGNATQAATTTVIVADPTNLPPEPAVPYSPVDGAAGKSLTPTLRTEDFIDSEGDPHILTQWQISTAADFSFLVFDILTGSHLTSLKVPDSVLDGFTTYYWRARFFDDRGGTSGWSEAHEFRTKAVTDDTNSNGIPDDQEIDVTVDVDNDGILDVDQMASDITFKSLNTLSEGVQMAVKGISNVASIESVKYVDPATVSHTADMPVDLPFGLISLKLQTVDIGDTVVIAIYFSAPVSSGAKWYKYDSANGWQDYSAHTIFSADRKTLELRLKDGGYGDSDGVENGIIVDPGGVVVPAAPSSGVASGESDPASDLGSDSGSGASCFIATVAF